MNASRPLSAVALAAAVLALAGCGSNGPKLYTARGKVMVNGTPAAGAVVVFHPKDNTAVTAVRPSALVGQDGSFALACGELGQGAPAGEYVVVVVWDQPAPPPGGKVTGMGGQGESKQSGDKLGGRYATPGVSKLTARIEPKDNDLPVFDLK